MVYIFHIGNLAETSPSELGGIRKHYCFLGGLHHYSVEARFHHIGSGDAEVEVDAVYADKQLAARKVCQYVFCIFPYHGQTAVPQYAAELNNIDVLFACQDIRYFHGSGNNGQFICRNDAAGKCVHGCSRCYQYGIFGSDEAGGFHSNQSLFFDIQLFFLTDVPVVDVRVYQNSLSVVSVQFLFSFEVC